MAKIVDKLVVEEKGTNGVQISADRVNDRQDFAEPYTLYLNKAGGTK